MYIIRCRDIQLEIVSYFSNIYDIFSWQRVCKFNYDFIYVANFKYNVLFKKIIIKNVDLSTCSLNNQLTDIIMQHGIHIHTLICSNDMLTNFFKFMPNITSLNCFNSYMLDDSIFTHMKNIQDLNCGKNHFNSLPSSLTSLNCNHGVFNDDFYFLNLINLTELHCGNCQINDSAVKLLTNLTKLYCDNNTNLTKNSLDKLTNLTLLDLGQTTYFSTNSLNNLTNLTYLNCGCNDSITLRNYQNTKLLYLNCGESIIGDKGLSNLPNITTLYCSFNKKITNVGIKHLHNLTYINCGWNKNITSFHGLTKLKYIDCGFNSSITNESFEFNTNIIYLQCSNIEHKLTYKILYLLPNLVYLYYNVKHDFLEKELTSLKKLKHISCRDAIGYNNIYIPGLCNNCCCVINFI